MYELGIFSGICICGILGAFECIIVLCHVQAHCKIMSTYKPAILKVVIMLVCTILMFIIQFFMLISQTNGDFLFYFTEFLKSIYIYTFIDMNIKLVGWDNLEFSIYSEAKFESILIRLNTFPGISGAVSLKNHEEVKWFILKIKLAVIQYCIISLGVLLVSIFLKFSSNDILNYGDISPDYGFLWLSVFKLLSAVLELVNFIQFGLCLQSLPLLDNYRTKDKFRLVKYCLLLTEVQPLVISLISKYSNLFGNNSYTSSDKSTFVIAFFYTIELLAFLLASLNSFSTTEYHGVREKSDNGFAMTEIYSSRY